MFLKPSKAGPPGHTFYVPLLNDEGAEYMRASDAIGLRIAYESCNKVKTSLYAMHEHNIKDNHNLVTEMVRKINRMTSSVHRSW